MSRVVIISGHPELEQSNANKIILNQLEAHFDQVDIRLLDKLYPDYQIDIEAEQRALLAADVVVLQFPFYWYSVPALLKKWLDDVFSYNFAYGSQGDKLKGKDLVLSFTIGGPKEAYCPQGYNHFRIEELMKPLEQTAYLAGMNYQDPVYSHGMVYIPNVYNTMEAVEERAQQHASQLVERLEHLLYSPEKRISQFVSQWFEQFDQLPQDETYFLEHLADDITLTMPEGTFHGHAGFRDWYQFALKTFKPGCDHQVEQVEIKPEREGYQVDLRIRLQAETHQNSSFNGDTINLLVNETWQVSLDQQGQITIHDYRVTPVQS